MPHCRAQHFSLFDYDDSIGSRENQLSNHVYELQPISSVVSPGIIEARQQTPQIIPLTEITLNKERLSLFDNEPIAFNSVRSTQKRTNFETQTRNSNENQYSQFSTSRNTFSKDSKDNYNLHGQKEHGKNTQIIINLSNEPKSYIGLNHHKKPEPNPADLTLNDDVIGPPAPPPTAGPPAPPIFQTTTTERPRPVYMPTTQPPIYYGSQLPGDPPPAEPTIFTPPLAQDFEAPPNSHTSVPQAPPTSYQSNYQVPQAPPTYNYRSYKAPPQDPINNYGAPQAPPSNPIQPTSSYGAPQDPIPSYNVPQAPPPPSYGAPQPPPQQAPPPAYGAPQDPVPSYNVPQDPTYGVPQPQAPPPPSYGAPQPPPQQAPPPTYGAPQDPIPSYNVPQDPTYGVPQPQAPPPPSYGAPQAPPQQAPPPIYGTPQDPVPSYGAPQAPPQQPPSNSYGAPQAPPQQPPSPSYGAPQASPLSYEPPPEAPPQDEIIQTQFIMPALTLSWQQPPVTQAAPPRDPPAPPPVKPSYNAPSSDQTLNDFSGVSGDVHYHVHVKDINDFQQLDQVFSDDNLIEMPPNGYGQTMLTPPQAQNNPRNPQRQRNPQRRPNGARDPRRRRRPRPPPRSPLNLGLPTTSNLTDYLKLKCFIWCYFNQAKFKNGESESIPPPLPEK